MNKSLIGNIYNSKFRSGQFIGLRMKLENELKIKNDTPGPGSYTRFSEFGVWVPKHLSRSQKMKKKLQIKTDNSDDKIRNYFRKKNMERMRTANTLRSSRTLIN